MGTRRARVEFTVDGERFWIDAERAPEGVRGGSGGGGRLHALGVVVASAWAYGPTEFLDLVFARSGGSWEGVVSFAFPDEGEPPGVQIHYLDSEETVDESLFVGFVLAYGRAELEARRRVGAPREDEAALERRLDELRGERC